MLSSTHIKFLLLAYMLIFMALVYHTVIVYPYSWACNTWTMTGIGALLYLVYTVYEPIVAPATMRGMRLLILLTAVLLDTVLATYRAVNGTKARLSPAILNLTMIINGFVLTTVLVHSFMHLTKRELRATLYTDLDWFVIDVLKI
jgi:hypothetical protein